MYRSSTFFCNLIENAIKFNKEGSSITINSKSKNGQIVVSVGGTGIGIVEK